MKPVSFFFLRQWIPKQSKTGVLHIKKKFLGFLILPLQVQIRAIYWTSICFFPSISTRCNRRRLTTIRNNGVSELTILAEIVEEKPQRNRKLRRINHVSSSHYDDQAFLIHQLGIILMMLYVVVERNYWLLILMMSQNFTVFNGLD
ncbi:uncharacterized protein LOC110937607 [Helianthus annuus]|uniref:uncharacterized protein LOC110937607 n=1 Tax=Helianthus annuus TaxID=4232 RepID=UPI000B8F7D58|nr:uncharacterized protein LOC110937607 [Helianthus annuus]